jgi:hypothetical protein
MKKMILVAIVVGLVITFITGWIDTTPSDLVGASWYGWPFAWKTVPVVVNPVASYDIVNFVADFVLWFVVAFVVMLLLSRARK